MSVLGQKTEYCEKNLKTRKEKLTYTATSKFDVILIEANKKMKSKQGPETHLNTNIYILAIYQYVKISTPKDCSEQ